MTRKPPSDTSAADAHSRRARLVARRGRRTRVSLALAIVVVLGAVAAGAYALNQGDTPATAVGSAGATTPTQIGAPSSGRQPTAAKAVALRKLDHAHPLKLWIGGDSLAGSFGPALGDQVGATGVVETRVDYRVSSGLWSNDLRNWDQRAIEQMALEKPDAVVFIIGTNDTSVVNKVDANGDGVDDWQAEYRMKVATMMDILVGADHRTVFWLGPPTLGTRSLDAGAKEIGEVMRQEAAKRAPDVEYLDTYKLFSTTDGEYSRHILDENGNEITARITDGVHFSEDGAQYLARAVFKLVDGRWHMTDQADLQDPIGWTLAPGSGESVPGFSSRPTSRYHPRSSSPTTSGQSSPDTTSPPDTSSVPDSPTTAVQTTSPPTSPASTTPRTTPVTPTSTGGNTPTT